MGEREIKEGGVVVVCMVWRVGFKRARFARGWRTPPARGLAAGSICSW